MSVSAILTCLSLIAGVFWFVGGGDGVFASIHVYAAAAILADYVRRRT